MKILVAEDDETIMNTYQLALKSRNHDIFCVSNGDECLKVFNDHLDKTSKQDSTKNTEPHYRTSRIAAPFDLVILDYRMPKKNGLEVAEQILSIAPQQRIIIASAYTHELKIPSNCEQSLELLQKPFGLDILFSSVEKVQAEGWTSKYGRRPSTNSNDSSVRDLSTSASFDDQFSSNVADSFDLFELNTPFSLTS